MIHVIRMGTHAEKDYFLRATDWYGEILVNANLLEGTASATSFFLFELARAGKGFFIDPVTYAFGLETRFIMSSGSRTDGTQFKRTFLNLARRYRIIDDDAEVIPRLDTSRFQQDPSFVQRLCKAVVHYQVTRVRDSLEENQDFILPTSDTPRMEPSRLLAPYFYMAPGQEGWESLNQELVVASKEFAEQAFGRGVWAVICIEGSLLDQQDLVERLCDIYGTLPAEGYCLWLIDFDEPRATRSQVRGLIRLVRGLKAKNPGAPIIDMYGGYFAATLHPFGMDGISHGVGYGERRGVVPVVGGGPPPAKYYLPALHEEIYLQELPALAWDLSEDDFRRDICDCAICRGLLRAGGVQGLLNQYLQTERRTYSSGFRDVPLPVVHRMTKFHFLHNRHMEVQSLQDADILNTIDRLVESYQRLLPQLGYPSVSFLSTWSEALRTEGQ